MPYGQLPPPPGHPQQVAYGPSGGSGPTAPGYGQIQLTIQAAPPHQQHIQHPPPPPPDPLIAPALTHLYQLRHQGYLPPAPTPSRSSRKKRHTSALALAVAEIQKNKNKNINNNGTISAAAAAVEKNNLTTPRSTLAVQLTPDPALPIDVAPVSTTLLPRRAHTRTRTKRRGARKSGRGRGEVGGGAGGVKKRYKGGLPLLG